MKSVEHATREIKEFKVQGANQIALYGLSFLRKTALRSGFGREFNATSRRLEQARPTAVVLHNCIQIIKANPSISTIDSLTEDLKTVGKRESIYSDQIIGHRSKIITYCHSGEAMSFIKHARITHRKRISVIACKTEPLGQGISTARELAKDGIPITLVDDNAIGFFIGHADIAVVGADAIRKEGIVNKVGTSLLAQAAAGASKPFYVIANSLKIDRRTKFSIEERPPRELKVPKGIPRGITIRNPAFDITPWRHVTGVINEDGIFSGRQFVKLL
ncbi:MAG TPA: translation initiation factor eIF-2B [Candidatus Nitrosotalea sp.]|nr:translation initiation factor eIF-2B [Candidatus Nitrosotalea sp.]